MTRAVLAELGAKVRAAMRFQAPPYEAAVDLGARADAELARSIAAKGQHDQVHSQDVHLWSGRLRRSGRRFRLGERANFNTNPTQPRLRPRQPAAGRRPHPFTARLEF